jgi:hypothetical protein
VIVARVLFRRSLWPARFANCFADLVEIDARGLDAEEPGHDCPKYRRDNQTIKQETRANRSQQDGKQKRGCHRADLGKSCGEARARAVNRSRENLTCQEIAELLADGRLLAPTQGWGNRCQNCLQDVRVVSNT